MGAGGVFSTLCLKIYLKQSISNVLTSYFIQAEVAVWRNEKTQEPEAAAEQRGLCLGSESHAMPVCQLGLAMNCPIARSWASPNRTSTRRPSFPSVKEEAGRLSHYMIP